MKVKQGDSNIPHTLSREMIKLVGRERVKCTMVKKQITFIMSLKNSTSSNGHHLL